MGPQRSAIALTSGSVTSRSPRRRRPVDRVTTPSGGSPSAIVLHEVRHCDRRPLGRLDHERVADRDPGATSSAGIMPGKFRRPSPHRRRWDAHGQHALGRVLVRMADIEPLRVRAVVRHLVDVVERLRPCTASILERQRPAPPCAPPGGHRCGASPRRGRTPTTRPKAGCAARAAAVARRTSSALAFGASASVSPVTGEMTVCGLAVAADEVLQGAGHRQAAGLTTKRSHASSSAWRNTPMNFLQLPRETHRISGGEAPRRLGAGRPHAVFENTEVPRARRTMDY